MTSYRVADGVAWVSREEFDQGDEPRAYVARLPRGPALALGGAACLVWLSIDGGGTAPEIAARVSELAGAGVEDVRDDVARLLGDLVIAGVVSVESASGIRP